MVKTTTKSTEKHRKKMIFLTWEILQEEHVDYRSFVHPAIYIPKTKIWMGKKYKYPSACRLRYI